MATPVERASDAGDLRREPKPLAQAARKAARPGSAPSLPPPGPLAEEAEEHVLDIQA